MHNDNEKYTNKIADQQGTLYNMSRQIDVGKDKY